MCIFHGGIVRKYDPRGCHALPPHLGLQSFDMAQLRANVPSISAAAAKAKRRHSMFTKFASPSYEAAALALVCTPADSKRQSTAAEPLKVPAWSYMNALGLYRFSKVDQRTSDVNERQVSQRQRRLFNSLVAV